MEKIGIISNYRMLLIFLLLIDTSLEKIFFIVDESIEINDKSLFVVKIKKEKNYFSLLLNTLIYYIYFYRAYLKYNLKNKQVIGCDHIVGGKFFLRRNPFILLEDGTENYKEDNYKRSLKNKLFSIPIFGMYKTVKKIYLTGLGPIPNQIKEKVEILNLKELWNKKNKLEKEKILEIFQISKEDIENLKKKNIILYTQPLSEDGIISEDEKVNLYRKILKNYDIDNVVIKIHPREKTKYKELFPNVEVIGKKIPSEILYLLDIKFSKVVTIFSTAALIDKNIEIDFYGTEINEKLFKKFGTMDKIMKRNVF